MLVLKKSDEGFMVNQHSKSITKPQFELQLHIALQWEIFHKVLVLEKDSCAHYLSNDTLRTFVAVMGAEL